jgi:hypothetical protein
MIAKQADAVTPTVAEIYTQQITQAGNQLEILQRNLARVQNTIETPAQMNARTMAFADVMNLGVEVFWQQEPRYISQTLHRLFGQTRIVVHAGEIIGLKSK